MATEAETGTVQLVTYIKKHSRNHTLALTIIIDEFGQTLDF